MQNMPIQRSVGWEDQPMGYKLPEGAHDKAGQLIASIIGLSGACSAKGGSPLRSAVLLCMSAIPLSLSV